jgi:hypothetical protein
VGRGDQQDESRRDVRRCQAVGTALDAARVTDQMRRITPEIEESIRQAPRRP